MTIKPKSHPLQSYEFAFDLDEMKLIIGAAYVVKNTIERPEDARYADKASISPHLLDFINYIIKFNRDERII